MACVFNDINLDALGRQRPTYSNAIFSINFERGGQVGKHMEEVQHWENVGDGDRQRSGGGYWRGEWREGGGEGVEELAYNESGWTSGHASNQNK